MFSGNFRYTVNAKSFSGQMWRSCVRNKSSKHQAAIVQLQDSEANKYILDNKCWELSQYETN